MGSNLNSKKLRLGICFRKEGDEVINLIKVLVDDMILEYRVCI